MGTPGAEKEASVQGLGGRPSRLCPSAWLPRGQWLTRLHPAALGSLYQSSKLR